MLRSPWVSHRKAALSLPAHMPRSAWRPSHGRHAGRAHTLRRVRAPPLTDAVRGARHALRVTRYALCAALSTAPPPRHRAGDFKSERIWEHERGVDSSGAQRGRQVRAGEVRRRDRVRRIRRRTLVGCRHHPMGMRMGDGGGGWRLGGGHSTAAIVPAGKKRQIPASGRARADGHAAATQPGRAPSRRRGTMAASTGAADKGVGGDVRRRHARSTLCVCALLAGCSGRAAPRRRRASGRACAWKSTSFAVSATATSR